MAAQKKVAKKNDTTTTTPSETIETKTLTDKKVKRTSKKTTTDTNTDTTQSATIEKEVSTNVVIDKSTIPVSSDESLSTLTDNFTEFMAKFQAIVSTLTSLKAEFRSLEKKAIREIKVSQKANAKKKKRLGNRSPSGFVKPTKISPELAKFLGKPDGTEMARTEVTREINGYIRQHSLQDKSNGRKINPDKELATLLKIKSGDELTYFNLQRYMSPHFAKATNTTTTTTTSASATA